MRRAVWLFPILVGIVAGVAAVAQTSQQSLTFESQCIDLDSGTVQDVCDYDASEDPCWDILTAYNADVAVHAVVVHNGYAGVEIAFVENTSFEAVTAADVDNAQFTGGFVDQPWDGTSVILIRTNLGAVYKLGNSAEDDTGVTFDFELL